MRKRKPKKERSMVTVGMILRRRGGPMRDRRVRRDKDAARRAIAEGVES